jgi:hypothetical protein
MPAITKEQTLAILRGNRLYNSLSFPYTFIPSFTKWSGIAYSDLFNPNGIDLSLASSGTYPFIPGTGNPIQQTFTGIVNSSETIIDDLTSTPVLIIYNGGTITTNSNLERVEYDYHKTGAKLRSKLK